MSWIQFTFLCWWFDCFCFDSREYSPEVQGWSKVKTVVRARVCAHVRLTLALPERCCGDTGFVEVQPKGQRAGKDDLRKETTPF